MKFVVFSVGDMKDPLVIAARAVGVILTDLADRSGLDGAWSSIDDELKREIAREWMKLIAQEIER